jgi:curli biogenesis system outer membrane secretion channel CsgG
MKIISISLMILLSLMMNPQTTLARVTQGEQTKSPQTEPVPEGCQNPIWDGEDENGKWLCSK